MSRVSKNRMIYENIFRPGGNTGSGQIPAGGNQLLSHSCVFSKCGRLCRLRFWETVFFPIVGTGLERVKSPIWIFQTGFRNFTLQPHFGASTLFFFNKNGNIVILLPNSSATKLLHLAVLYNRATELHYSARI